MKNIFSFLVISAFGISFALAQAPASTSAPVSDQSATPAVNAVEMSQPGAKCGASSSCCSSANKASMVTTRTTSVSTTESSSTTTNSEEPAEKTGSDEGTTEEKKCQTVGFGMSAQKPQN